jgi:hypothetical protein
VYTWFAGFAWLVHKFCVVWFCSVLLYLSGVGWGARGLVFVSSASVCSCSCALKSPKSNRSVEFGVLLTSVANSSQNCFLTKYYLSLCGAFMLIIIIIIITITLTIISIMMSIVMITIVIIK